MEKRKNYTVSVYTENNVGLLHRISAIFLKRHINIESFTTSESEIKNVYRFIIVVKMTKSGVERVIKQIEKQVEVIKAFYHRDDETIFQESALYKMKSSALFEERHIQNIIKDSNARIVTVNTEFFVIEKTGFREDTEKLYKDLAPFGLLQFTRSGRIAVSKEKMGISDLLSSSSDTIDKFIERKLKQAGHSLEEKNKVHINLNPDKNEIILKGQGALILK